MADGESDKGIGYAQRIADRSLAITPSDLEDAYFRVLEEVLDLQEVPYVAGHRAWQHDLLWPAKNVARLGYLLLASVAERLVAQPRRDFYLFFLPFGCAPQTTRAHHPD